MGSPGKSVAVRESRRQRVGRVGRLRRRQGEGLVGRPTLRLKERMRCVLKYGRCVRYLAIRTVRGRLRVGAAAGGRMGLGCIVGWQRRRVGVLVWM